MTIKSDDLLCRELSVIRELRSASRKAMQTGEHFDTCRVQELLDELGRLYAKAIKQSINRIRQES